MQARVVTVSDRFDALGARGRRRGSQAAGCRVELDGSSDKLGAKIRNAQLAKIPFTLVIGEKEVEAKGVAPRRHGGEDLKTMPLDAFVELLQQRGDAAVLSELAGSPAAVRARGRPTRRASMRCRWPGDRPARFDERLARAPVTARRAAARVHAARRLTAARAPRLGRRLRCLSYAAQHRLLRPAGEVSRPG